MSSTNRRINTKKKIVKKTKAKKFNYPLVLQQACDDLGEFVVKLRTNEIIFFDYAVADTQDWILLMGINKELSQISFKHNFKNGMSINIQNIIYIYRINEEK